MRVLLTLCLSIFLTSPAWTHRVAAAVVAPQNYAIVDTAAATHSQEAEKPFGCFVKLMAMRPVGETTPFNGPAPAPFWAYTEYNFICQRTPDEVLPFYVYNQMDICDTGEQGAYTCGLHGKDRQGNPIDRPPAATLATKDARAVPDLVAMVEQSKNFRARQYAAMLEDYANDPALRSVVADYKGRLSAIVPGEDDYKKGALVSLLLTLGVEQPAGASLAILSDYAGNLTPKHLTALATIARHADDSSIKAADLMHFYVRNFVDNTGNEDPNRAAVVAAVTALGARLQPSVGLLLDRMRDSPKWPPALQQEAARVACAAFPADSAAGPQTLVTDDWGSPRGIACP